MSGPEGTPSGADRLAQIDFFEYPYLIRVPGESDDRRFVATNEVTAEGAREAGWEVIDLRALVEIAKAAREHRCFSTPATTSDEGTAYCPLCEALARLDSGADERQDG